MNRNLVDRVKDLDPVLGEELVNEFEKMDAHQGIINARQRLGDEISHYAYDVTGQDGEEEIERAATDYIDAQDDYIKRTDPERWSEMQMGA